MVDVYADVDSEPDVELDSGSEPDVEVDSDSVPEVELGSEVELEVEVLSLVLSLVISLSSAGIELTSCSEDELTGVLVVSLLAGLSLVHDASTTVAMAHTITIDIAFVKVLLVIFFLLLFFLLFGFTILNSSYTF